MEDAEVSRAEAWNVWCTKVSDVGVVVRVLVVIVIVLLIVVTSAIVIILLLGGFAWALM